MPLHFAITITQYSPRLRVASDLCSRAIYISSKCFSIPAEERLSATQTDMWAFTFQTTPVFLLPLTSFQGKEVPNTLLHSNRKYIRKRTKEYILVLITAVWVCPWGYVVFKAPAPSLTVCNHVTLKEMMLKCCISFNVWWLVREIQGRYKNKPRHWNITQV